MFIGIDVGSTNAKLVVIDKDENIIKTDVLKTGMNSKQTSEVLFDNLKKDYNDISDFKIVATGYGRISIDNADKTITEISCHAKGATKIFNKPDLVIIDIGGQDTKIIDVQDNFVKDFIMNDKCSAGTGRFLDIMSKTMDVDIDYMCEMAKLGGGVTISSLCTVFAESEVITLIGRSEKKENIANAIVMSIVNKVASQTKKINYQNKQVCLTGGLCELDFIIESLSNVLNTKVISNKMGRFAGALGAALYAKDL